MGIEVIRFNHDSMELTGNITSIRTASTAPAKPARWSAWQRLRADRWTGWHVLGATIMAALAVLACSDAWSDIWLIASKNEEYSHIFLVPFVAGAMIYVRRARFRHCKPVGTSVGFVIAALGWMIHVLGFYRNYESLWHGGAVLVLVGCILAVFGKHALFRFFPAIAVLVFLIPVPGMIRFRIASPLQTWTAQISEVILTAFNVPILRNGNALTINGEVVNIAEACNGLRMVFALVLVSYAFGFGLPLRNSVRFVILLASPLAAIGCNVLRILPTVWLYGHDKHNAELFHDYSGWLMLPISFLILLAMIRVLRWAMIPVMRYSLAA
jgi:exosortase